MKHKVLSLILISIVCLFGFSGCENKSVIENETMNTTAYREKETQTTLSEEEQYNLYIESLSNEDFFELYVKDLTEEDIESARKTAYNFYDEAVWAEEVISIEFCENASEVRASLSSPYYFGEVIVFSVELKEGEYSDYRYIALKKKSLTEWGITNEGR